MRADVHVQRAQLIPGSDDAPGSSSIVRFFVAVIIDGVRTDGLEVDAFFRTGRPLHKFDIVMQVRDRRGRPFTPRLSHWDLKLELADLFSKAVPMQDGWYGINRHIEVGLEQDAPSEAGG
jgi:hypothetical protein